MAATFSLAAPGTTPDGPRLANVLARVADSVSAARSLEALVRPLLEMLEAVTGLESTYLTAIDESAGVQHVVYARNARQLQIPEGITVPWEDTLCHRAIQEGRPYVDDVDRRWGDSDAARALGITTYASTPVRTRDGSLYGTLCAASGSRVSQAEGMGDVLRLFSMLIGQHIEREQLLESLRRANAELATSALVDSVTGLPNRRALLLELARMLALSQRDGSRLLLAFLDLDGFKAINDSHGHDAGDRFLAAMGAALTAGLRGGDYVARFGGDEFVLVAHVADGSEAAVAGAAEALRERLTAQLAGRFDLGTVAIDYAGPSVGVIAAAGEGSIDALLARADAAMYAVKRARRAARR